MSDVRDLLVTDELAEQLERRVAAIEEVIAARWPRRLVLAGRLRRRLRASMVGYDGPDFSARHAQACTWSWMAQRSDR